MEISLTPELEKLVSERVASGRYESANDVVHQALRLLEERDELQSARLEELKRQIMVGIEQLDEGRSVVLNEETLEGIKRRGRERLSKLNSEG